MKIFKISYLFLIIGFFIWCFNYVYDHVMIEKENNKISYSLQKEMGYLVKDEVDFYDMILSVPQIKLKKGIYQKNDKRNNIDEGVTIHEKSSYPDINNSNVILMAHSGSGNNAYFNNLYKLNNDSLVELYYDHVKYVYKINNWYLVEKNGFATIRKEIDKKSITLITCSQEDKTKQLIYIGYLIDEIQL